MKIFLNLIFDCDDCSHIMEMCSTLYVNLISSSFYKKIEKYGIKSINKSTHLGRALMQSQQNQCFMWNLYGIAVLQITCQ